jgi:hypothetical protein
VAALACHFHVLAPSLLAELTTILLAAWYLTEARDMSALFLLLIGHLQVSPLKIPESLSTSRMILRIVSIPRITAFARFSDNHEKTAESPGVCARSIHLRTNG